MIIPASWLTGDTFALSRRSLFSIATPLVAHVMPFDVFKSAYIDTAIVVLSKEIQNVNCLIHYFPKREKLNTIPQDIGTFVPVSSIRSDQLNRLSLMLSDKTSSIFNKLNSSALTFGNWFDISRGIQPYSRKRHSEKQITDKFLHSTSQINEEYLPELQGKELARYMANCKRTSFIRYCDDIASSRPLRVFQGKRIVLRRLLTRRFRLQASIVTETFITTDNILNIVPKELDAEVVFALGILNSKIISWFYVNTSMIAQKDDFPQVHISALLALPIPNYNGDQKNRIVALVDQMLALHKQLVEAKTPHDKTTLQRQIDATDHQIDQLVYELYGLTEEEIAIVERP
jgi:hypothetical protein